MESQTSKPTGSQAEVLTADNLQKNYGARQALRGLTFTLKAGRVLGFLGPNGAGKTTAIRILTTIMDPDAGHFVVDGIRSEFPEKIRRRIGVLPENLGFPRQITGIEYLTFFGQLYGRSAQAARAYGMQLLQEVGLESRAKSLIGTYSHGMRQRIGIARALVNDPRVIFLDEPTLGLDPRGQKELLALIQRIAAERKVGVILCSHALSEIEDVCNDVIILMAGRVIASGTVADVVGGTTGDGRQNALRLRVPSPLVQTAVQIIRSIPLVTKAEPIDELTGWMRIELDTQTNGASAQALHGNNRILEALIGAEVPILSLETEGGRLQDIFLQLTDEVTL